MSLNLEQVEDNWDLLLSPDQQEFVAAMLITQSVRAASEMADIPYSHGLQLAKAPKIQAAMAMRAKKARTSAVVTPEDVIMDLKLVRDIALGRIPSPETKWADGVAVTTYVRQTNLPAANKAIENMGRVVGMFTDKKEISLPVSDSQLKRRLEDLLGMELESIEDAEFTEVEDQADSLTINEEYDRREDLHLNDLLVQSCDEEDV